MARTRESARCSHRALRRDTRPIRELVPLVPVVSRRRRIGQGQNVEDDEEESQEVEEVEEGEEGEEEEEEEEEQTARNDQDHDNVQMEDQKDQQGRDNNEGKDHKQQEDDNVYRFVDSIDTLMKKFILRMKGIVQEFMHMEDNPVSDPFPVKFTTRLRGQCSPAVLLQHENELRTRLSSPFFGGFRVRMGERETRVGRYVGDRCKKGYRNFTLVQNSAWEQLCADQIATEDQFMNLTMSDLIFHLGDQLLTNERWNELVTEQVFSNEGFVIVVSVQQS